MKRMETRVEELKKRFSAKFNCEADDIFTSPGRIELLGNHTDHNNGKVLVSSVNLNIVAAAKKSDDNKVIIYSKGYKKMVISLSNLRIKEKEYFTSLALVRGVLYKFKEEGFKIGGFHLCCDSNVPKGAGVSSSASFELLIAKILAFYYNNDSISPIKLAQIAQFAESKYFNKPCGLLDQMGIALGGINFIDFKDTKNPLVQNIVPNIKGYQFILISTGDDHAKLTSCYKEIKDDMKLIANHYGKEVLREVDESQFYHDIEELTRLYSLRVVLRAKHYFEENKRVEDAYLALKGGDNKLFLNCLNESGNSSYNQLKNCYVESEDEKLPTALRRVKNLIPGCFSRVHGGGFAGTMLLVVKKEKLNTIMNLLYQEFGKSNVMKVSLTDKGATKL